uniref:Ammonium transporter AmtB-like domain-containing protein n=1 Tax=Kalanchoe fedtschenkoi TaxID=63787 RepID=A0A7N0VAZ3_KALFE
MANKRFLIFPWPPILTLPLHIVDDTLGVFHTHAVAGLLGGLLTGLFAEPVLCRIVLPEPNSRGAFYGGTGGVQFLKQIVAALFVIGWNIVSTTLILLFIRLFIPLRMSEDQLAIGDDAVHGEEAYALWGDGEKFDPTKHNVRSSSGHLEGPDDHMQSPYVNGARGITINL